MRFDDDVMINSSGVSWGAILAGGAAAAAMSLILLSLGFGLGFAALSPWTSGTAAAAIGIGAAVWLIFVHVIAAALGGYLAGRLRVRWPLLHTDEVYFRDTAHGLLTWAVSVIFTAAMLATAMGNALGLGANVAGAAVGAAGSAVAAGATGVASAVSTAAGNAEERDGSAGGLDYFAGALLRSPQPGAAPADAGVRSDVAQIIARSVRSGSVDTADREYLSQVIAARTGLTPAEAGKRIDDTLARARAEATKAADAAREAADTARKAAAYAALWSFIALLSGAFAASLAAVWGGRRRDHDSIVITRRAAPVGP